jgi:hypothetical protein
MPEHIKAHLRGDKLVALRVAKRKKGLPQDAVIPARGEDEDGRRDLTLILRHVPARVEIVLRIIPGVV